MGSTRFGAPSLSSTLGACCVDQNHHIVADRKFKRPFGAVPSEAPPSAHGAFRTPSAARQPRQRAPAQGVERHSTAPLGLDLRRRMGEGRRPPGGLEAASSEAVLIGTTHKPAEAVAQWASPLEMGQGPLELRPRRRIPPGSPTA